MSGWSPKSWQDAKIKLQMPTYDNLEELNFIKMELGGYDELVSLDEILTFRNKLTNLANGNGFLIVGGDCAESFDATDDNVVATVNTIRDGAKIIGDGTIKAGRMAGQYAKPRSSAVEIVGDVELPSYRGDIINGFEFTAEARKPKPELMKKAFNKSRETLAVINELDNDFYTSHEALLLDYEEPLVRERDGLFYLSSTAFPWIGDRTRFAESAHVEFLRGVVNPVSIKCGPKTDFGDLVEIIKMLNPTNEIGKIILTVRASADKIRELLQNLIEVVVGNGLNVIFVNDPMHGNGRKIGQFKTRYLDDVEREILGFFEICRLNGVHPAGVHLEMTGLDVTECVGCSVNENELGKNYKSLCDPRLNRKQSLYLFEKIAKLI